ncbi:MAG TPA: diphosphomevalonate decarboxylase [Myxococcaceae bacterium]|nr:diphosphomevalonate decarboxylase [Myxococcaceae bacterium]
MTAPVKATAVAHPNIALVKYWGKRDQRLILPHQSSLSITIAPLSVRTTVEFRPGADEVELNGKPAEGTDRDRVVRLLDVLRKGTSLGAARVVSRGDFPVSAGLASSAAGFAALAVAAREAAGLPRDARLESILARFGSGSACRSIQGGICVWRRGRQGDGSDSFAEQLVDAKHWPELRLVVAVVSREEKDVDSREGMHSTVETSPYYGAWIEDAEGEIPRAEEMVRRRDLEGLGQLTERNAWRMHAAALAADPPLCYLRPPTLEVILRAGEARQSGLPVWFTLDAGPNPILLTDASHEAAVVELARDCGAAEVVRCVPGGDARIARSDLF